MRLKSLAVELLLLVGVLVFARGLLPPTRTRLGFATEQTAVPAQFDRMVFMVVDAMRSDFIFANTSSMPGIHSLLRDGRGYAFTAFSDPPTVTLPRLKGITTGASPNFLDAVINIAESDTASSLHNQDSWVHQLQIQNKSMHMYGDETWLLLFPDAFDQNDGTSSFYVADFTEVDNNITRHLDAELSPSAEWDTLILHYLGLDHIGHKGGPNSPHMQGKQKEMDSIVTRIFESLDESTLFVVAGDHGMNDVGNHGGASQGETSAALALFAKKFNNPVEAPLASSEDFTYYSRILQVDIVPTLAMLLGFPVPQNSLGVFISDLLDLWQNEEHRKTIMNHNCKLLGALECTADSLRETQRHLMRSSSEHILGLMYAGIAILAVATVISIMLSYSLLKPLSSALPPRKISLLFWIVAVPVLYFVAMMGSSTVEEEHFVWYWCLSGILGHAFFVCDSTTSKMSLVIALVCFRVIRGWNSTGQKWTALPDTAKYVAEYPIVILITFFFLQCVPKLSQKRSFATVFTVLTAGFVLVFKFLSRNHPVGLPWMIWLARTAFATSLIDSWFSTTDKGLWGGLWGFVMMSRLHNIPLWVFMLIARRAIQETASELGPVCTMIELCFEYATFFAFGGSNSLATVDLSNAYNGVSGYNIPLVGLLTFLGNWAPSLFWVMLNGPNFYKYRALKTSFYCSACLSVTLACLILREHLFIWTVFSPKLLYVVAWLLFHEIVVGSLLALTTSK